LEPEKAEDLKASIKEHGILEPITCVEYEGKLVLVDGLHRLLITKELGLDQVPVMVKPGGLERVLIENVIRTRLRGREDPVQCGEVIKSLMEEYNYNLSKAARELSISETTARRWIKLTELPEEVKAYVRSGQLKPSSAYWLTHLDSGEKQLEIARYAIAYGYTEEQTKAAVKQALQPELPPEETGWAFTPEGRPERVYPPCEFCGRETGPGGHAMLMCPECIELARTFFAEYRRMEGPPREAEVVEEAKEEEPPSEEKAEDWWPY